MLTLHSVVGLDEIVPGMDLGELLANALAAAQFAITP
jgi:coenzyme F420-0:L-glutamate ligase/coenzyme F420-1:gamma-L-glutamate ligase